jgi:flavin-dependent dehydrogenase
LSLNANGRASLNVDVAIVGGGPAGIATALTLAGSGASVLVVERSFYEEERVGETFPPAIRHALARLDLWEEFAAAQHVPSQAIRCLWGGDEPYERSFIFDPYGTGWHVNRQAFDASLALAARRRGVHVKTGHRLLSCEREATEGWRLRLESQEGEVWTRARFVVDATGRAATLVRRLGGERIACDRLVGIYGYFKGTSGGACAGEFTLIEAVEEGWWYSAPLPGERLAVALMTDADLCARNSLREVSSWTEKLSQSSHTLARTCSLLLDDVLRVVPAHSSMSNPLCGRDWLAVGDAATALDPLSGDGVLRALGKGIRAAEAILKTWSGDRAALTDYRREMIEEFRTYIERRDAYYHRETRWSETPFWTRRRHSNNKLSHG